MLRWVFLDIGNVLMNDDPAMALLYRELHRMICQTGYRIPFARLLEEREALIRERGPEHWGILGKKYLGDGGHRRLMERCARKIRNDYMGCHEVLPGAPELLERLASRYRIGVVANQLREVIPALREAGLGERIEVYAVSEQVGIRKPDTSLYRWACEQARCAPHEAVMIGDRPDNDIAPARAVGLWTILFQLPHELKGYEPFGEYEKLYFASQLRASICRIAPACDAQMPDAFARSFPELEAAVEAVAQRAAATTASAAGSVPAAGPVPAPGSVPANGAGIADGPANREASSLDDAESSAVDPAKAAPPRAKRATPSAAHSRRR